MSAASAASPAIEGLQVRKAPASAVGTWNRESRTVGIVISTGAEVTRRSYSLGEYVESLAISAAAIDLKRFAPGMSLLDSHDAFGIDSRVGTILPNSVRIEAGKLVGTAKLSRNARGEALANDLDDGHPLAVSVGYSIDECAFTEATEARKASLVATRWTPVEVSIVNIPADAGAHSRNLPKDKTMSSTAAQTNDTIAEELPVTTRSAPREQADLVKPKAATRRQYGTDAGLRGADLDGFVDRTEGQSERQTRAELFNAKATIQERTSSFPHVQTAGLDDHTTGIVPAMAEAIVARLRPGAELSDRARQYVGMDFPDLGRELLRSANVSTMGMSRNRVLETALETRTGYHTTSDFAAVLGTATNTVLRRDYAALVSPIRDAFARRVVDDFREIRPVQIGHFPSLLITNEHGEFRRGTTIGRGGNGYAIGTYGRIFGVSRQLLINDQLGAIDRVIRTATSAAAELENDILIGLVENPAPLAAGPVFSLENGNLATPSALSTASLDAAIQAVEKQTGIDGRRIYQRARFLIVPTTLRFTARQILAQVQAARIADVNPLAGELTLIVEPRLTSDLSWYVVADPVVYEGAEYALLAGNEQPFTDSKTGFDVDGVEFKVRHDFGGGWIDHRSWFKNPGAVAVDAIEPDEPV